MSGASTKYTEIPSVGCCPRHWGIEHKIFVTEPEEKCWACLIDTLTAERDALKAKLARYEKVGNYFRRNPEDFDNFKTGLEVDGQ